MRKTATPAGDGRWAVTWRPRRWDREAHPGLPEDAAVQRWLHEVNVSASLTLWLFTTLEATGLDLAELYHRRQDVETDNRDLKETLGLTKMTARSVPTVEKELLAAVLAYNLANQVRGWRRSG